MSWWDPITSFIGENKGWLEPVVSTGVELAKYGNNQSSRSQYLDYLRKKEQENYARALADTQNLNSQAEGSRAAAMATESNRVAAAAKANEFLQNSYKDLLKMYGPSIKTANNLMPKMSQAYQQGLGLQRALASYVSSPEQMAKLSGSVPAYAISIPLPDSVRLR